MTSPTQAPFEPLVAADAIPDQRRLSRSAWSWAIFEGGRDPYVIIIMALAFMPYFVSTVVGDPVKGQAMTAAFAKYSGIVVALTAPFLGAIVDRVGPRKPWLALVTVIAAVLTGFLWMGTPRADPAIVTAILWITAIAGVLIAYTDVFHNSLMPYATRPAEQVRASGLALSLGNLVGLLMIVGLLWAFTLPGTVSSPLLPSAPLFGLDRATGDNIRVTGPLVGAAMLIALLPLLLFSHDAPRTGTPLGVATREGVREIWLLVRHLRAPRDAILFLVSRMLFSDARLAALMFGGIYAAGQMGWGASELLIMGLMAAACGVLGGFVAGWMDARIGPRNALIVEIAILASCAFAQLTISPEMIFFIPWPAAAHPPLWAPALFNTLPQLVFLALTLVSSVVGTSVFSSSRTMLSAVAPKENIGAFFGLYALSGAATAWLAPLLIEAATDIFQSQKAGMVPIGGLFLAGIAVLLFVRGGGTPTRD